MCHCVFKCYNKTPRIPINREQVLHINAHFCYKNCWFSQVFLGHALLCLLQNFPAAYTAGWTQTFQYNSSPQLNWVKVMWHSRAFHYRQPPPSSNISCTASEVSWGQGKPNSSWKCSKKSKMSSNFWWAEYDYPTTNRKVSQQMKHSAEVKLTDWESGANCRSKEMSIQLVYNLSILRTCDKIKSDTAACLTKLVLPV